MSSRIRSELGTLADRTRQSAPATTPAERRPLPCHVFVDDEPALLVAWDRRSDGWWGRVLHVVAGEGAESWVAARLIRPA